MAVTIDDGTFQKVFVGLVNLLDRYFIAEQNLQNVLNFIEQQTAEKQQEEDNNGEREQQQD